MKTTDLIIHDPSTIIREADRFYVCGTGHGVPVYTSTNLMKWSKCGPVFDTLPAWINAAVPKIRGDYLWAPDIQAFEGGFRLYYAASTFGSNVSAIGLATTESLHTPKWADQGTVIQSKAGGNFNAIDPAIVTAHSGDLYLSLGSFWSGIKLVRLNPKTGKQRNTSEAPIGLAARPQVRGGPIEAPYIYERGKDFWLFVNWDACCRGERSTYNIRIGRSARIEGPYADRDGVPMLQGGGTLLLDARPEPGLVGPGHAGILNDRGAEVFSCHYEFAAANGGKPTLALYRVAWERDGWPRLDPF